MNREKLGLETKALALDCSLETYCQHRREWKPLEKEHQCGWESFIAFAALCARRVISESRSLEVERKVGGKFHLKLNISLRPIANKYHEGKMKRTLKRGLKVFEIAERKVKGTSLIIKIDMCIYACCFLVSMSSTARVCGKLEFMMFSCLENFWTWCSPFMCRSADKMVLFNPSWNTDQGV